MTIVLITILVLTAIDAMILNIQNYSQKKKFLLILEKTGAGIEATNDEHTMVSTNASYAIYKMTNSIRRANGIFEEIKKIATSGKEKK
jgi:hypothetical protein